MSLKQALGYFARALMLGSMGELLVISEDHDARPLPVGAYFVDLETDMGVPSHPLDFLPQ
jgi:hypothetical protein